jgi:hypothetical protein
MFSTDNGGCQNESVVDAQIGALHRAKVDQIFDDVVDWRVQQIVRIPALETLRRGLCRFREEVGQAASHGIGAALGEQLNVVHPSDHSAGPDLTTDGD